MMEHEKDIQEIRNKFGIGPEDDILLLIGFLFIVLIVFIFFFLTISYFFGLAEDKKTQEMWEKKQREWSIMDKKRRECKLFKQRV
jgi:hypothetical protein